MALALAGALALGVGAWAGAASAQDEEPPRPERELHVLLTSAEGIEAPGLQTLKAALREAGHRVTLVAPARDHSHGSAALHLERLQVRNPAPGEYVADVSPATCVALGLSALADPDQPFDLLLAGTQVGARAGSDAVLSGGAGATALAALGVAGALPAIALGTPAPRGGSASDEEFREHLEHVAQFALKLLTQLAATTAGDGALLPPGTRLQVSYPLLPPDQIRGVRVTVQATTPPLALSFEAQPEGVYVPRLGAPSPRTAAPDSDVRALAQGYVAIAPLDTDFSAPAEILALTAGRLAPLRVVDP
jgi:5'-nucleotidase